MNKEGKTRKIEGKKEKEKKKKKGSGGVAGSPSRGHVAHPEGFLGACPEASPGDTCSPGRVPGASPGSPSRGHVAHPEGFRGARPEAPLGDTCSPGRVPCGSLGSPPWDTRLNRRRKEKKTK